MRAALGNSRVMHQVVPSDLRESDPRPTPVDSSPMVVLEVLRTRFGAGSDIELMLFGENA